VGLPVDDPGTVTAVETIPEFGASGQVDSLHATVGGQEYGGFLLYETLLRRRVDPRVVADDLH